MPEEDKIKEIRDKLRDITDNSSRIDFLQNYLRNSNEKIELKVLAEIYSLIGELSLCTGKPRASYYQKAASTWETVSVLGRNNYLEKAALKKAAENYRKALKIYKKEQNFALVSDIENKMLLVREQLYKHIGPMKKLTILSVMLLFVFSFLLLSSGLTGFTVVNVETDDSASAGIILAVFGVIGMFLILRWWR